MTDWSTTTPDSVRPPLTRSHNRTIAGVVGGIAAFTGIKPLIVRALFVVLALAGGAGFLVYISLWLLLPPFGSEPGRARAPQGLAVGGALLLLAIIVGLLAMADVWSPANAVVLAGLFAGIVMLNSRPEGWDQRIDDDDKGWTTSPEPEPTGEQSWPSPIPPDPTPADPTLVDPTPVDPPLADPTLVDPTPVDPPLADPTLADPTLTPPRPRPPDSTLHDPTLANPKLPDSTPADPMVDMAVRSHWAVTRTADETVDTIAKPQPPPGPAFGSIALAALAAVLGVALVLNTVADIFVGATTIVGTGMAVVGLLMTVAAFTGRARRLVPLTVILLLLLPVSPVIDHAVRDGVGSSSISVDSPDELQPAYRLGVGSLSLDLSDLEVTEDTMVVAEVGTGGLEVIVPRGVPVLVQGETTVGGLWILGEGRGGIGNQLRARPDSSTPEDAPRLILDVSVTIGGVDVYRAWHHTDFEDREFQSEDEADLEFQAEDEADLEFQSEHEADLAPLVGPIDTEEG